MISAAWEKTVLARMYHAKPLSCDGSAASPAVVEWEGGGGGEQERRVHGDPTRAAFL